MTDPQLVTNPDLVAQVANLNALLSQLSQFTSHVSTGAMTAHAIQWLKGGKLGALWKMLSDRGKVIAGLLAAALPAAGITFTFSHPSADTYGFIFAGVTWGAVATFVWSLLQNWVFQQGWYQSVIKAKEVTGVAPKTDAPAPPSAPVAVVEVRS